MKIYLLLKMNKINNKNITIKRKNTSHASREISTFYNSNVFTIRIAQFLLQIFSSKINIKHELVMFDP